MKKRQLLVCDLDGTLLDSSGEIDFESLQSVKNFINRGNDFCICTGRMDEDIKYVEKRLGIKGKYRISQNGCLIMNSKDEVIYEALLSKRVIKKINEVVFNRSLRVEVSDSKNRHFPSPRNPEDVAEFVDTSVIESNLEQFTIDNQERLSIYLIFGDKTEFSSIIKDIKTEFPLEVNAVQTSNSSLEVFSKRASKGIAVQQICKLNNLNSNDVFVAGDAENDLSMFELTENSFAVGNPDSEVRKNANTYVKNVGEIVRKYLG